MLLRARSLTFAAVLGLFGCERRGATVEASAVQTPDDKTAILKLFDEAEACGDRYDCPPLAKLQDRAEKPGELRVLEIAFDIMVDPKTNTFERRFKMASMTARAWAAARTTNGHTLSAADEKALHAQVVRLLARPDNVVPAHGFIEYLSDARAMFQHEALDPKRGNDEVHSAIRGLRDREKDLSTVKAWLAKDDERAQLAGALLLDGFNHDLLKPADEVAVMLAFAQRPDTHAEAAKLIVQHADGHDDGAFEPVLRALTKHKDAQVRELAEKALATN